MATPDISQQAFYRDGNAIFDKVHVLDKIEYDFTKSGLISISSLNVIGVSTFQSDVTFGGDISLDEITCRNANVTGIATVGTDLYLNGKLFDADGDFGTAGQLLSSDGTNLNWIDASTTSVANANNVGTNVNSTNADQFITFVGASSGNNPIRVNTNIKYNPSSNTLSQINIAGTSTIVNLQTTGYLRLSGELRDGDNDFGTSGQVLSSDGTDTKWINTGSLTAGAAAQVAVTNTTSGSHFLTFVDTSSGNEDLRVNTNLTYNTSTQVISGKISNISNHDTDGLSEGSSNLYHTTARVRAAVSATGDLSYNSSNGQFSVSVPSAFVSGMIILWSGNTGNIPTGFVLCDGNNGTPNLTDRFVVGAGSAYGVGATGGSSSVTLSTANLPSHNHSFSGSTSHSHTINNHTHSFSGSGSNTHSHGVPKGRGGSQASISHHVADTAVEQTQGTFSTTNATISISVSGTTGNPSDRGTNSQTVSISGTTGSQGSGTAHENRPPYYALCYIMKT